MLKSWHYTICLIIGNEIVSERSERVVTSEDRPLLHVVRQDLLEMLARMPNDVLSGAVNKLGADSGRELRVQIRYHD